jgi:hypothetical protein
MVRMLLNIEDSSDPTRLMQVVKMADAYHFYSTVNCAVCRNLTYLNLSWEDHIGLEALKSQETIFGIRRVRHGCVETTLAAR